MAFELSYSRPVSFWNSNNGIPLERPSNVTVPRNERAAVHQMMHTFAFGYDPSYKAYPTTSRQPECRTHPERLECNTFRRNRTATFEPQDLYSQYVRAPGADCLGNPLKLMSDRPVNHMYGVDMPHVYVSRGCDTITPEVGPTEPTRDTTYGKMLWTHPVYTFPDVRDLNAIATGIIYDKEEMTSHGFDDHHFETFTKNSPDYIHYVSY